MENKQRASEQNGFDDDEIAEAVVKTHPDIGRATINRGKTTRTTGDICTPITVLSDKRELQLLETVYHKASRKDNLFDS